MYHHYKPLRNFVRKLDRTTALIQIWNLLQNIHHDLPLPIEFSQLPNQSIKGIVHPWELEILTREIILNAGEVSEKNLFNVTDLLTAINHIRRIVDEQSKSQIGGGNILHEMHRISQQQFPWQIGFHKKYGRYLKIYNDDNLASLLFTATGLTINQIYLIGTSISGNFLKSSIYDTQVDFTDLKITNDLRDLFIAMVSIGIEELKERTIEKQEYNENWSYTINPLLKTPLIVCDPKLPNKVICPIPNYIFSRISEGLIFDIYKINGYENPYGLAYQSYVIDISNILLSNSAISVEPGKKYHVSKQLKHGVDLYLYDENSAILIECKAKRLNLNSKYQGSEESLASDLKLLAKFVVQNYKNLIDVLNKVTPWDRENRTLHPIIVTLMECYIWTPPMRNRLNAFIEEKLITANLDPKLIESTPFTIMSIDDYELSIQIIKQIGVQQFFLDSQQPAYLGWSIGSFISVHYKDLLSNCRRDYLMQDFNALIDGFSP